MDKPIDLVPLVCVQCSQPIPANPDQVAWVCEQCGQGMLLNEIEGLVPLTIQYLAGIEPNQKGKPYWVVTGQVQLDRETYGKSGKHGQKAHEFWMKNRYFFVPAFKSSLEDLLNRAKTLLLNPPNLQAGSPAPFEPVILSTIDIQPTVEFIVMAIEADRKDKVKKIDFTLRLSTPVLWILP